MSTKYSAGSVLIVGGSRGLTGAPMLAALAAFRADAGYVAVGAPESTLPVLEAVLLEAVKRPLAEDGAGRLLPRAADAILEAAEKADAVAIGPGLGRSEGTVELVRILLERLELPVVLDADALWELEPFTRAAPTVLTPHSGELARSARHRRSRDRRAPARRRAPSGLALRLGRAAQGSRHARRRAAHRRARRDLRHAGARNGRLGRRAHRRRRCVPREGDGGAVRRGRRRGRARRRLRARRPAGRHRRVGSPARASARARRSRACSARRSHERRHGAHVVSPAGRSPRSCLSRGEAVRSLSRHDDPTRPAPLEDRLRARSASTTTLVDEPRTACRDALQHLLDPLRARRPRRSTKP